MESKQNESGEQLFNTLRQLRETLESREKKFNEDPNRFVEVVIKRQVTSVDLSGAWMIVERQLKKSGMSDDEVAQYKERNAYFTGLFLDIEKLKQTIEKEKEGSVNRRHPVLREKGRWIIKQAGEFRSVKSIHTELTKRLGYSIALNTLKSYVAEHKTEVDKLRDDFRSELLNSSISVETGRLKFYEEAYEYYYHRWKADGKPGDFKICNEIINEVRSEIKGDIVVKIDGKIDINHSVEANKSLGQKLGELNVNMIVIGLAAQKAGINPLPLYTQLATSYYNRWNGVAEKPNTLKDKDELIHVSGYIKNYNWDEIRQKNEVPVDMGTIEDAVVINKEEEKRLIDERVEKLKNILNEKK